MLEFGDLAIQFYGLIVTNPMPSTTSKDHPVDGAGVQIPSSLSRALKKKKKGKKVVKRPIHYDEFISQRKLILNSSDVLFSIVFSALNDMKAQKSLCVVPYRDLAGSSTRKLAEELKIMHKTLNSINVKLIQIFNNISK